MILSALLTSVGINLGLCFLFFTLYSILRKQPGNVFVYAPRLVHKEKSEQQQQPGYGEFNLQRLLPSAGWVRRAWQLSDDELLSISGLDALVFTRIFTFSVRVFTCAVVVGICILLPVNYLGNQLSIDFHNLPNKSLDSFSISNVDDGSNRLWIHFSAAYVFTGVVCYLLYCNDVEKLYKKLARLKSESHSQQTFKRSGFLGLFGRKVNIVEHYEKKLETLEENVRLEQYSSAAEEVPAAFVSFKSRFGAAVAVHIQQGINPTEWITEQAPEPENVHWPFFSASFLRRWICKLVVIFASVAVTILFLIPVVIVQGLANLNQLQTWFPFLKSILNLHNFLSCRAVVSQVITGYLPSLVLQLFLFFVPPIMILFSSIQGYISRSQIEKSACNKVLWFSVWNIFFANVLSGSALYMVDVFLEPKNIPSTLAAAVPSQASFFISYVVTSGWTSLSSELFRLIPLLCSSIKRLFSVENIDELEVPSLPYYSEIPAILFFGLLGITYFFLAPLILPFLLVFFCMGYIIHRNQLLNVYAPKYETGGEFWPIVHNGTIFSLILMHIIAIGLFGLKKLPLASSLTIPLPVLTLIFNEYCRKRFLPLFKGYPTECLIKKDREDQNEPSMTEFYDKLVTAYRDPALLSAQYARNMDRQNAPLLHAEV
ncbi:CSC1-like protein hyp1 [Turnera subulata]|uniref:CSC1-like protein hyp1 n=1 Tax=Turnera subulata TaxID=218843 RepID=A0A9Q0FRM0_9ROSI|nr:CSC1-like protein hyp1 [Turnera subulata]